MPLDGPYYEELHVGQVMPRQPPVVIDEGMVALYQSMVGERLAMTLDPGVCAAVTGEPGRLASPALVMHLSLGHSTTLTRRVIANLFFRDVRLLRPVFVGQSIATTVTVVALADSRARPGRPHRGKVLAEIVTTADGEPAVSYQRAPLLPQRGNEQPGHADDLGRDSPLDLGTYAKLVPPTWDFTALGTATDQNSTTSAAATDQNFTTLGAATDQNFTTLGAATGRNFTTSGAATDQDFTALGAGTDWEPGVTLVDPARDVIDNALGLVRLTNNLAMVHRDAAESPYPQRLVYGGHVVGLAQASLSRLLPGMATVVGWHTCNHLGPAFEGDQVSFQHTLLERRPLEGKSADRRSASNGSVFAVQVEGFAHRSPQPQPDKILDWTVIAAAP